jgi:hypothetical protein
MSILRPKTVSLDTSTWGLLAKEQSLEARHIRGILSSGDIIPFFTDTVLRELFAHENNDIVEARLEMIRRLPFVTYLRGCGNHASIGWLLDLRETEIAVIRDLAGASAKEVLEKARGQIEYQFCSGDDFFQRFHEEWKITRLLAPSFRANTPEITALTQFPLPGVDLSQKIPSASDEVSFRSFEDFRHLVLNHYEWLVQKLRIDGDKAIKNPEQTAASFLHEICANMENIFDSREDILEKILAEAGVERTRLPPKPTIDDIGFESIFIGYLKTHERRLNLPFGSLKQFICQEQVPSWLVWKEVARAIRRLRKSEASSFNDKLMLPFALYLDGVEVDKRIRNCVREAAPSDPLMGIVNDRVFRRKTLEDLAATLKKIAGS